MSRLLCVVALASLPTLALAQESTPSSDVRVTVSINADGSRTTYQFDNSNRSAVARTSGADGKLREVIRYLLDERGRFQSGEIFGPDNKMRYKSLYKYDAATHLIEETHLTKDDVVINKIVFQYDTAGKQTGYSVFDASGKLIGHTSPAKRAKR